MLRDSRYERTDDDQTQIAEQHADDPCRKITDEHFITCLDLRKNIFIEEKNVPASQRTYHHGSQYLRIFRIHEHTNNRDGRYDPGPFFDQSSPGIGNQNREEKLNHELIHFNKGLLERTLKILNERRNDSPSNEDTDVRHDHSAEVMTKPPYFQQIKRCFLRVGSFLSDHGHTSFPFSSSTPAF